MLLLSVMLLDRVA